jgi:conjugative relaxase-like TrwC/TraI family protein
MMLSIGRVGPAGADYYTTQIARGSEDYYLGAGETPGQWAGTGAGLLGLTGEVGEEQFRRVLDGCHPTTGERLVPPADGRLSGLDLTFSAPKSVSLLWALHPDTAVRAVVADAHHQAVTDGIRYLESDALFARRGRNGVDRVPVQGFVAAGFGHRTSRAGDPQLHTHVVAANIVADHSGRWSAPDSRSVYRHARAAGFVYQARLRHELTTRLGVTWTPVRAGTADLTGVPRTAIDAFSTRRTQITTALQQRGLHSAVAAQIATLATRPGKDHPDPVGLIEAWQHHAQIIGIDLTDIADRAEVDRGSVDRVRAGRGAVDPYALEQRDGPTDGLVDELVGPGGLTARSSTFDRRAVVQAVAQASPTGATLTDLQAIVARVVGDRRVIALTSGVSVGRPGGRWTTVELLTVEADLIARATRHARAAAAGSPGEAVVPTVRSDRVADALDARPQLSSEQTDLVWGICATTAPVVTVVGKPGTGKTFALDAARAAWQTSGVPVVGAALAARAAAELQGGSGIPSTTLTRLLADMERPEGRLITGSVVVVDEAGMIGTRDLHRLITLTGEQSARVVLVGDPAQLPEISAGGAFARLTSHVPTHTLTVNRRQVETWEQNALDLLRHRQPGPALTGYSTHGRVTIADTAEQQRDLMVTDWHVATRAGQTTLMLATTRADVADLNRRAQTARIDTGELNPQNGMVVGDRRFLIGDQVICGRNDRRAGLTNGTRLVVTDLDPDTAGISGVDPTGQPVTIPGAYVTDGHVTLGYATTIHKAQGATVDRAFLLGDDRLYAEAGYVGLSRGRTGNQLYVVTGPDPLHRNTDTPGARTVDHLCTALGVTRAQTLSTAHVTDRIPDQPLSVLVTERDRLTRNLINSMPPRAPLGQLATPRTGQTTGTDIGEDRTGGEVERKLGWVAGEINHRDRWTAAHRRDGERLARLTAAIDRRVEQLGIAALVDPPDHLTRLLGPPPDTPHARTGWARTAARIEAWRDLTGRSTDRGTRHLLTEPGRTRPEHEWWDQATRAVRNWQTRTPHHHTTTDRATDRTAGLEQTDGLDRSWTNDNEKGLSR